MESHDEHQIRDKLNQAFGGRIRSMWSGMAPIEETILRGYEAAGVPLFEAYGMTEFGPICSNIQGDNRYGSVGKPLGDERVEVSERGEIVVHSQYPLTIGYLDEPPETEKAVYMSPNMIATGDIGYFDEDGFLYLRGRKSEIVIMSSGQKVHPRSVEAHFYKLDFINQAVAMGNGKPYLGLLLSATQVDDDICLQIEEIIAELNRGECSHFPIKKWKIITEEFTTDNQLLTRNMKVHRGNIAREFESEIFS